MVWARASTWRTPGITGRPGKWPWKYHSAPVTAFSPTIRRASGSYSTIRSTRRKGQRWGMSFWISALVRMGPPGVGAPDEGSAGVPTGAADEGSAPGRAAADDETAGVPAEAAVAGGSTGVPTGAADEGPAPGRGSTASGEGDKGTVDSVTGNELPTGDPESAASQDAADGSSVQR